MKKILFYGLLLIVISCSKGKKDTSANPVTDTTGTYDNGFFILNAYGDSTTKDVSFYNYDNDSFYVSGFRKENPGSLFGDQYSGLSYGTVFKNRLYLVASGWGYVVIANPATLKEIARIKNTAPLSPAVFLGISEDEGLLSTGDGIYRMALLNPVLGGKIEGIDGYINMMIKVGDYIFVYSRTVYSIMILDAKTYKVVKTIPSLPGFVVSKDGNVWAMGEKGDTRTHDYGNYLLRINPTTLKVDTTRLPFYTYSTANVAYAFRINMTASTKENVLFLASQDRYIYRYVIGDAASLYNQPIVKLDNNNALTGDMVEYDAQKDKLVLLGYEKTALPPRKNKVYICDPVNGTILRTIIYTGNYFATMAVFK